MSLKDTWKTTGKNLGFAFRDVGKSIVKSAATAVHKADDWANGDEAEQQPDAKKPEETSTTEE